MTVVGRALVLIMSVGAAMVLGAGTSAAAPSEQDRAYLRTVHQTNLAVISAAGLAVRTSKTEEIRRHAQLFLNDHKRLDAQIRALGTRVEVALPDAPSSGQQKQLAQLSTRTGRAFDSAWLELQIWLQRQSLEAGRRQVADGTDPQVKTLARLAGQVVQAHVSILEETAAGRKPDAVEGGTSGESAGEPVLTAPLGLGLVGLAVVLAAGAMFVLGRRRRA